MSAIEDKIKNDFLFGCIRYKNKTDVYLMPVAYWILNYEKYDPFFNPDELKSVFRQNILNVTDSNFDAFYMAIAVDRMGTEADFLEIKNLPKDLKTPYFFINLDSKLFVTAFVEIAVEEYLPDSNWTGLIDYAIDYLPEELKQLF
jgi:hypothetical protein